MKNCFGWCVKRTEAKRVRPWTGFLRFILAAIYSNYILTFFFRGSPEDPVEPGEEELILSLNLESFTFDEIEKITNLFCQDQLLGGGGGEFGSVYKGLITEDLRNSLQPQPVAVRVLDGVPDCHKEWKAEVMFLGHHSHPNLLKLIGYNWEDEHRILVYEYLALGTLEDNLYSRALQPLSWRLRMKIAYGVAKGLAYLHEAEKPVILEKPMTENILLDEDYNPKLSDFEFVRTGPVTKLSLVKVLGGYEAPESIISAIVSTQTDVYSFGIVLLKLVTGRKAFESSRKPLIPWSLPFLKNERTCHKIVDPRLQENYPIEGVHEVGKLIYQCLSASGQLRPSMREVMEKLKPHQDTGGDGATSSN